MSSLLAGRASAADRQHHTVAAQLQSLRRVRILIPVTVLAAATIVGGVAAAGHMPVPVLWWALFAVGLPAVSWWILEAACRSQHRAVLRAAAIRDAAWAAAARRREHLTAVDG
jgi:hypothetical protein